MFSEISKQSLISFLLLIPMSIRVIMVFDNANRFLFPMLAFIYISIRLYREYRLKSEKVMFDFVSLVIFGYFLVLITLELFMSNSLPIFINLLSIISFVIISFLELRTLYNLYFGTPGDKLFKGDESEGAPLAHTLQARGRSTNWMERTVIIEETKKNN